MKKNGFLYAVLQANEKWFVREALKLHDWNKVKTAETLGISMSSLYRKIAEFKIKKKK